MTDVLLYNKEYIDEAFKYYDSVFVVVSIDGKLRTLLLREGGEISVRYNPMFDGKLLTAEMYKHQLLINGSYKSMQKLLK